MKKILVVDDQENLRQLLQLVLGSGEREIYEAESGERAIEIAHTAEPDLIILDLVMPGGMDGLAALEILKADPQTRRCPVLVLTAWDQLEERERALESGAMEFMAKPFDLRALQQKVSQLLA
ncbi:MAG: response regulator [Desulfuromonadales bacterium]|nr:response regulator [Desulfuromonadales bacterium]